MYTTIVADSEFRVFICPSVLRDQCVRLLKKMYADIGDRSVHTPWADAHARKYDDGGEPELACIGATLLEEAPAGHAIVIWRRFGGTFLGVSSGGLQRAYRGAARHAAQRWQSDVASRSYRAENNPPLEAIIFDADGTLIDSLPPHIDFCHQMNAEFDVGLGASLPARNDIRACRTVTAAPMDNFFRRAGFPENLVPCLVEAYEARFAAECPVGPFEGIGDMLRRLTEEYGLKVAVVSSNTSANVRHALGPLLSQRMTFILGIDNGPKDKAEAIREALCRLRLTSGGPGRACECAALYVGDTEKDSQKAAAAGMRFVGVDYGFEGLAALQRSDPEAFPDSPVATTVAELASLLFAEAEVGKTSCAERKAVCGVLPAELHQHHVRRILYFEHALVDQIVALSQQCLQPVYDMEEAEVCFVRQSLWRGFLSCFLHRHGGEWNERNLLELRDTMVSSVMQAEARLRPLLASLPLEVPGADQKDPQLELKRVVAALNILLKSVHGTPSSSTTTGEPGSKKKMKKADLEWGGTLWEIFEEGYPPNCTGIEALIVATYACHPLLEMPKTLRVGLAPDHVFFQTKLPDQQNWGAIESKPPFSSSSSSVSSSPSSQSSSSSFSSSAIMDIVGTSRKLRAEPIKAEKLRGYRYAFGKPEWIEGPRIIQMEAIWDLFSLDKQRAIVTSFKQHLSSFTDMDYFRRLSVHRDMVMAAVYDRAILQPLARRHIRSRSYDSLESERLRALLQFLMARRAVENSMVEWDFWFRGGGFASSAGESCAPGPSRLCPSLPAAIRVLRKYFAAAEARLAFENYMTGACLSIAINSLELLRAVVQAHGDRTTSRQKKELHVLLEAASRNYVQSVRLAAAHSFEEGAASVKFGTDADALALMLNVFVRVTDDFLKLEVVREEERETLVASGELCARSGVRVLSAFWDFFSSLKAWFRGAPGIHSSEMIFLNIGGKGGARHLELSVEALFETMCRPEKHRRHEHGRTWSWASNFCAKVGAGAEESHREGKGTRSRSSESLRALLEKLAAKSVRLAEEEAFGGGAAGDVDGTAIVAKGRKRKRKRASSEFWKLFIAVDETPRRRHRRRWHDR